MGGMMGRSCLSFFVDHGEPPHALDFEWPSAHAQQAAPLGRDDLMRLRELAARSAEDLA
jgi:hypothetical protein